MTKRLLALLLAILMAATMTACSRKARESAEESAPSEGESSQSVPDFSIPAPELEPPEQDPDEPSDDDPGEDDPDEKDPDESDPDEDEEPDPAHSPIGKTDSVTVPVIGAPKPVESSKPAPPPVVSEPESSDDEPRGIDYTAIPDPEPEPEPEPEEPMKTLNVPLPSSWTLDGTFVMYQGGKIGEIGPVRVIEDPNKPFASLNLPADYAVFDAGGASAITWAETSSMWDQGTGTSATMTTRYYYKAQDNLLYHMYFYLAYDGTKTISEVTAAEVFSGLA